MNAWTGSAGPASPAGLVAGLGMMAGFNVIFMGLGAAAGGPGMAEPSHGSLGMLVQVATGQKVSRVCSPLAMGGYVQQDPGAPYAVAGSASPWPCPQLPVIWQDGATPCAGSGL